MRRARLALIVAVGALALGAPASPAEALAPTGTPPAATEGAGFSANVATFTDGFGVLGCPGASQYAASIAWGDGATTAGTVTGGVGTLLGPCLYAVGGAHTYAQAGSFDYTVSIGGPSGSATTGPVGLVVHDAPLHATAAAFSAGLGTLVSTTVASFTDANPTAAAADFSATISWGDGTTSAGAVAAVGGGFAVTATHTYPHTGRFAVSVTIKDLGGSQASAGSTATVLAGSTSPPPTGTPPMSSPAPAGLRLGLSTPVLARGGTVVVGVRCPVAAKQCRGRLKVTTIASPRSKLPTLRRAQILGTTLFIIPGGRQAQLSIRPKRAVVALLRRAGAVKVNASASSVDAATGHSQLANLTAKLQLGR